MNESVVIIKENLNLEHAIYLKLSGFSYLQVLPIYVFIRLFVASYLFLSGYGHFSFFWNKGDFGLYRFCQVILT